MRKIFIFSLIIISMIMMSSCGTIKYQSDGEGTSVDKEIAIEKSKTAALGEAAQMSNANVTKTTEMNTVEEFGQSKTTFSSRVVVVSNETFRRNEFSVKNKRRNGMYDAKTKFTGKAERR